MLKKIPLKEIGVKNLILLLVSGIALILLSAPGLFSGSKEKEEITPSPVPTAIPTPVKNEPTEEERLKSLLSKISGVGEAEVMIIYGSSQEEVVLKDGETTILTSIEGREEMPYIIKTEAAVVKGVVVVAEGGGNGQTATHISNAVEALFGIEKHKIIVLPMK